MEKIKVTVQIEVDVPSTIKEDQLLAYIKKHLDNQCIVKVIKIK